MVSVPWGREMPKSPPSFTVAQFLDKLLAMEPRSRGSLGKAGSEGRTSKSETRYDSSSFLSKYKIEVITDQMCH